MKFIFIILLFALNSHAETKQSSVIYGEDNRQDLYEVKNEQFLELAKSTAGMILISNIAKSEDSFTVKGPTMIQRGFCASERFSNQITAANCSGFLIGENLIATAGHCLRSQSDCERYAWVFNYKQKDSSGGEIKVGLDDVYFCKKLVKTVVNNTTKNDYAIVELTQKTNKRPLKFRKEGEPSVGASVFVIGHPTGLPTKIADGAIVRSLQLTYFVSNLDTYGGNSGSAVFDLASGLVEGILVRGEQDYVRTSSGCAASNICTSTGCRGEDVTYSRFLNEPLKLLERQ